MDPINPGASSSGSTPAALPIGCGTSGSCGGGGDSGGFVTWYVNKWTGKVMKASDYGYKAWPFGHKK